MEGTPEPELEPAPQPHHPDAVADETTRLLCAAVHRYDWFSDGVIREYLVEQVGTVPPSPGLDTAAVLRDAAAARFRRRVRDLVLLVLLLALAALDPLAVILWAAGAYGAARALAARAWIRDMGRPLVWLGALVLIALVTGIKALTGVGLPWGDRTWWPSLAITVAMLLLLNADTYLVRTYLRWRFKSGTFAADHTRATSRFERWLRGLGLRSYAAQLQRFADADEHGPAADGVADVIVHRGETPFVGAGFVLPTHQLPVSLRPAPGRAHPTGEVDVSELYALIAAELVPPTALVRADGQVEALVHREQLLVPVDDLIRQRGTAFGSTILRDLDDPPLRHLPLAEVRAAATRRIEWARYYSCFRRESWSRQLVTSCYLHLTRQNRTLQIEVTHCVLPPIREWLTEADRVLRIGDGPLNAGSAQLLCLPLTVGERAISVFRSLRPRRLRTRGIAADRYGAGGSVREGVSWDKDNVHYFKSNDASAQVTMTHNELFSVVINYLEERGYDVSELGKRAETLISNNIQNISNSTFVNSTIANNAVNPSQQPKPDPTPASAPA